MSDADLFYMRYLREVLVQVQPETEEVVCAAGTLRTWPKRPTRGWPQQNICRVATGGWSVAWASSPFRWNSTCSCFFAATTEISKLEPASLLEQAIRWFDVSMQPQQPHCTRINCASLLSPHPQQEFLAV